MKTDKRIMDLAFTYASHRCDPTVPDEVVAELANKIAKEELTEWDVAEDSHDLDDDDTCLFNQ
jgi:hypothetical protein